MVPSSIRRLQMSILRFMAKLLRDSGRRKQPRVRRAIPFRPALESLEDRRTPATVSTSLVLGNLTITDSGASNLTISQPAANQIRITAGDGTTITTGPDGGSQTDVTIQGVTGNLAVNLGTGNDTVTFDL